MPEILMRHHYEEDIDDEVVGCTARDRKNAVSVTRVVRWILELPDLLACGGSCFHGKNRSGSKLESSPKLCC